jgi:exonuclease V gamma subunit
MRRLGAPATPSPVVWDLLRALDRYYCREGSETVCTPIHHPLHAFDSAYFTEESPLASFSKRHLRIAEAMAQPKLTQPSIELVADPEPSEPKLTALSVQELAHWIWHPTRRFIERRLHTRFDESMLYEPTGSLVELDRLETFLVGDVALTRALRGKALRDFLRAAPEFPDGDWGLWYRERLAKEVEDVIARRQASSTSLEREPQLVTVELGGAKLQARLDGLQESQRVKARFSKAETKTELTTWLEHLLMQAANDPSLPSTTELFVRPAADRPRTVRYDPVSDAPALLEGLMASYHASQLRPAPLLNRASWVFARYVFEGKADRAVSMAEKEERSRRKWDRYARFVWGQEGPFANEAWVEAFGRESMKVYGPLFSHRRAE